MRWLSRMLLTLIIGLVVTAPSHSIPAFARKYGFNCAMCHSAWPRLNDFGLRYRLNGYQVPGQEDLEKSILELSSVPLALRTSAGYTSDRFSPKGAEQEVNQFRLNGLDVLGGGLLGRDKGFFVAYLPQISGESGVEPQTATLEQANVVFSRLTRSTCLNTRVGKFEAAYVPFSQLRSITVSPYEIYAFDGSPGVSASGTRGSRNPFALADTTTGLELYGWGLGPSRYYFGFTNGSSAGNSNDSPSDFYLRGVYVLGPGLGLTTGQAIGATAYFGRARDVDTGVRGSFNRLGVDASLNAGPYDAELQYIHGSDEGIFNVFAPGRRYEFSGGFVQVNRFEMESGIFLRYDWVNTPSEDDHDINRWTVGWRRHLDHPLMLQLEYSHRTVDNGVTRGAALTENLATARLDWAF